MAQHLTKAASQRRAYSPAVPQIIKSTTARLPCPFRCEVRILEGQSEETAFIHSFIHSFIHDIYIVPLQEITTQRHSQPSMVLSMVAIGDDGHVAVQVY